MKSKIQNIVVLACALTVFGCEAKPPKIVASSSEEANQSEKPPATEIPQTAKAKAPKGKAAPVEKKEPQVIDRSKLKETLTPLQYNVAVKDGTEPPFRNAYWDNKKDGIYVDIISGKPLFSSREKFKSGTGWPSFWKPFDETEIVELVDRKLLGVRTEVRSKTGDTHLGHVFPDGPEPTGLRYCLNSAALRFVPVEDFEKEGLTKYIELFAEKKKAE